MNTKMIKGAVYLISASYALNQLGDASMITVPVGWAHCVQTIAPSVKIAWNVNVPTSFYKYIRIRNQYRKETLDQRDLKLVQVDYTNVLNVMLQVSIQYLNGASDFETFMWDAR